MIIFRRWRSSMRDVRKSNGVGSFAIRASSRHPHGTLASTWCGIIPLVWMNPPGVRESVLFLRTGVDRESDITVKYRNSSVGVCTEQQGSSTAWVPFVQSLLLWASGTGHPHRQVTSATKAVIQSNYPASIETWSQCASWEVHFEVCIIHLHFRCLAGSNSWFPYLGSYIEAAEEAFPDQVGNCSISYAH